MIKRVPAVLMCLMILLFACTPTLAASDEELEQAKTELKNIQKSISENKKNLDNVKAQLAQTNHQLEAINQQIAALDMQMAGTKAEVAQAEAVRDAQEKALESRLNVMYMYGETGYIEVLFSSEDFSQMLSKLDSIRSIVQADRAAVNALDATKRQIESKNADLEAQKQVAVEAKALQEDIQKQQSEQAAALQKVYDDEIAAGKALAGKYGLNGMIFGDYQWPIDPGNAEAFIITSRFSDGQAIRGADVIAAGGTATHEGVDIGVSSGTPVMAIADGTVIMAAYNGGYGNYVGLDHGKDTDGHAIGSGYGHLSEIKVTQGQQVKKGDVVGLSGNTGASTGPHLHFNFIIDSKNVDPLLYFSTYTFNIQE